MEALLISGRKKLETVTLKMGQHRIVWQPMIRYLGVLIDARLDFKAQLVAPCKNKNSSSCKGPVTSYAKCGRPTSVEKSSSDVSNNIIHDVRDCPLG